MPGLHEQADLAVLLALGAALFIAIGDVMHQRQAHEVTDENVGHVELFLRLLREFPEMTIEIVRVLADRLGHTTAELSDERSKARQAKH